MEVAKKNPKFSSDFFKKGEEFLYKKDKSNFNKWLEEAKNIADNDIGLLRLEILLAYYSSGGQNILLRLKEGIKREDILSDLNMDSDETNLDLKFQESVKKIVVGDTTAKKSKSGTLRSILADKMLNEGLIGCADLWQDPKDEWTSYNNLTDSSLMASNLLDAIHAPGSLEELKSLIFNNNKMENENNSLIVYVTDLVRRGLPRAQIKDQLMAVGWSENDADAAYSRALVNSGAPVPSEAMQTTFGKKSSAMEITLNLFSFVLLGIVATALGTLFYQIINKYFPDPLVTSYYSRGVSTDAIHYSIAALIIGFPIYYFSMRMWFRGFQSDEGKMETRLTKWITYIVLLAASIVIVGDLVTTVFTLLQGEISARFFLKALTIFAISGSIFGFYFLERRKVQYRRPISRNVFKSFGTAVSVVVIIGIILGFIAGGSPATERKRGLDNQRENSLSSISNCVENYARQFKRLPKSLSELQNSASFSYCANEKDPETGKPFEYRIVTESKTIGTNREGEFELCATFSLQSEEDISGLSPVYYGARNGKWNVHKAGRDCDTVIVVLESTKSEVVAPIN